MALYPSLAVERATKIQEVKLRWISKQITWIHAAEIIAVSPRTMTRWLRRYQQNSYVGPFDRCVKRPWRKRVPLATVELSLPRYGTARSAPRRNNSTSQGLRLGSTVV